MRVPAILLATLALVCTTALAQQFSVYKWVDKDGVPQYTDRPPASREATRTNVRFQRTDPNAVMARVEQQAEQAAQATARARESADEKENAEAKRKETQSQAEENCARARERAATYNTARRLYRPLADGEREYLTDQELSDARAAADEAVSTWCK